MRYNITKIMRETFAAHPNQEFTSPEMASKVVMAIKEQFKFSEGLDYQDALCLVRIILVNAKKKNWQRVSRGIYKFEGIND